MIINTAETQKLIENAENINSAYSSLFTAETRNKNECAEIVFSAYS